MGGKILSVNWALYFEYYNTIFNDFITHFMQLRKISDIDNILGKWLKIEKKIPMPIGLTIVVMASKIDK